jgi:hypothetical protein
MRRNDMSRFKEFQNVQVFNAENEPLNGHIFIHDSIINFENGYISNWYNKYEDRKNCPAINCIDGHIEYWENGVLNNDDAAVYSSATNRIELWENGQYLGKVNFKNKEDEEIYIQKGKEAEFAFAKYLNKKEIPFIHLCQLDGESYSEIFRKKNIKRPDYLIFIDKKPIFIEVKATSCYTIEKEELQKLNNLKNEYLINIIFAVTDINEKEFINYNFMSIDNLNNYVKITKNKKDSNNWYFYPYSKSLLKNEILTDNINNEELEKMYCVEEQNNKFDFNVFLKRYIKENNFKCVPPL